MFQPCSPLVRHCRFTHENLHQIMEIREILITEREPLVKLLQNCAFPIDIFLSSQPQQVYFQENYAFFMHNHHPHETSNFIGVSQSGNIVHISLQQYLHPENLDLINAFHNLYQLDLCLGEAETIPDKFQPNFSCHYISLIGNQLKSIPFSFTNFKELQSIRIHAPLTEIPTFFHRWEKIKHIELTSQTLNTIPWLLALRNDFVFAIFANLEDYYSNNRQNDFNHFTGESRQIIDTILDEMKAQYENMPAHIQLTIRVKEEMKRLYPDRFHIIVEKIKTNMALDPLDWTHPEFIKWGSLFEKLGEQYPTETYFAVHQKLNEQRTILGTQGLDISL